MKNNNREFYFGVVEDGTINKLHNQINELTDLLEQSELELGLIKQSNQALIDYVVNSEILKAIMEDGE